MSISSPENLILCHSKGLSQIALRQPPMCVERIAAGELAQPCYSTLTFTLAVLPLAVVTVMVAVPFFTPFTCQSSSRCRWS